jgi:hypothetical protein
VQAGRPRDAFPRERLRTYAEPAEIAVARVGLEGKQRRERRQFEPLRLQFPPLEEKTEAAIFALLVTVVWK